MIIGSFVHTADGHCRVIPELKALGVTVYRELLVGPYRVPVGVQGRDVVALAFWTGGAISRKSCSAD